MNELKFNSQVCTTKEQSQRLLDLGLKPETADMSHQYLEAEWDWFIFPCDWNYCTISEKCIPAWSLHRLMLICAEYYLSLHLNIKNIRLYDHIIDIIENLIKLEKIDKKYLQ